MTTTTNTEPAAWIGCLSCYNNGHLLGTWITAQQAADEQNELGTIIYAGRGEPAHYPNTNTPYVACVQCGGDEFDVFDTEHLPTKMGVLEFYNNAETLAELDADTLERLTVLGQWLGNHPQMNLADLISYDDENYSGQWDTFQDYAENYADDTGLLDSMPDDLRHYFDYEAFARDLAHDYYHDDATGHTWRSV